MEQFYINMDTLIHTKGLFIILYDGITRIFSNIVAHFGTFESKKKYNIFSKNNK